VRFFSSRATASFAASNEFFDQLDFAIFVVFFEHVPSYGFAVCIDQDFLPLEKSRSARRVRIVFAAITRQFPGDIEAVRANRSRGGDVKIAYASL